MGEIVKKITKILAVLLCCVACMPLLVACNGKYGTELKSVMFTQEVFEADEGQTIKLKYKTYPSTATNYNISYEVRNIESSQYDLDTETSTFRFRPGAPSQADVKIIYGRGQDDYTTCKVIKKEYPTEIYFEQDATYINKNGAKQLKLMAKMADGTTKVIDKRSYNIELISSAPNIVSVDDQNMIVTSTGAYGFATITARIIKLSGGYCGATSDNLNGYEAEIDLQVIDNIASANVWLSDRANYRTASTTRDKTAQNTITTTADALTLNYAFYSKEGGVIDSPFVAVDVVASNSLFVNITKNADGTFALKLLQDSGVSCIEIVTDASDESGDPVCFMFYLERIEATG